MQSAQKKKKAQLPVNAAIEDSEDEEKEVAAAEDASRRDSEPNRRRKGGGKGKDKGKGKGKKKATLADLKQFCQEGKCGQNGRRVTFALGASGQVCKP